MTNRYEHDNPHGAHRPRPVSHSADADRGRRRVDGESALVRFAREYGWRAYAIPVLAVITVFVLLNMFQNPDEPVVEAAVTETQQAQDAEVEEGQTPQREVAQLPEGEQDIEQLPPGGPFTESGDGTFYAVGVPGANTGRGEELTLRYIVEVERGVDTTAYGGDGAFAAMVDATLADPRGWTNDPRFRFEHVAADQNPDVKIRLTSLATTRELCGFNLGLETSCRTRVTGEDTVVINESRWVRGAAPYEGDIGSYRQYVINHEVGHALGFAEHVPCPEPGVLAPIMMQQTLSLNNSELNRVAPDEVYPDNDFACRANPWPYPRPAV